MLNRTYIKGTLEHDRANELKFRSAVLTDVWFFYFYFFLITTILRNENIINVIMD